MPAALLHPGVYIEEVSSGVRTITGVATSIALFIGWAPRGPVDKAVRLTSFADFERAHGGLDQRSLLGYSVKHFYDNGGSDAYVIRIADAAAAAACDIGDLHIEASSPGEWGNDFTVRLTPRADPDPVIAARFLLEVVHTVSGAVLESFTNLSMQSADARFVETMVNGRSAFIDNLVVNAPAAPPAAADSSPLDGAVTGNDGAEFGPNDPVFHTALTALTESGGILDRIDLFNIVCVPGLTNASAASQTAIAGLQTFCKNQRAFLIIDSIEDETVANMQTNGQTGMTGSEANYSALYYPWVSQPDPLASGAVRDFPPCGFVAGVFARTDSSRGVWKAPAGSEANVNGAVGLEVSMSDSENGQLNPLGINCLRTLPVFGNVVWGARTLHGQNDRGSEWKYVPVRRMALFLEESLYRATQWVVFEPNDEPLWAQIRLNIGAFMQGLFRQGAFQGTTPKQAYFVKCDRETTTQADINLGVVNIMVGFAPLKPAEFVVLKIQQIAGDIPV